MKKVIVATLVAALGASAWADFTKVQESFEDKDGVAWTYSADEYWSSTDTAASDNITTVAYGEGDDYDGYSYDTTGVTENTPAVDGWSGDKYLNLAKATNLSRNFAEKGAEVIVTGTDGYILDTLVNFTATEAEDAPTPTENDKFLIWLQETELDPVTAEDGTVSNPTLTNLVIKCGNDDASTKSELTLLTSSGALPVNAGEWARVSVKAIPLYKDGPLGFVVYINGAAVSAGELTDYQNLFTKTDSLTESAKGYYALNQIFPSLTSSTSLTAVDFKGTGKIDDFQLVAASDQPAFIVTPVVVTIKGMGANTDWSELIVVDGDEISTAPTDPVVKGYNFLGWYTVNENGEYVEATFPLSVKSSLYAKFENATVAKIGEEGYTTLQAAIDAAIKMDSATTPVQIDIICDITITTTVKLVGAGSNTTHIVFNNNEGVKVTFNMAKEAEQGFTIDNASVTFKGLGSWSHEGGENPANAFCIGGEGALDATGERMLAPAFITIEEGSYSAEGPNLFNVQNGTVVVNGGSFKVSRKDAAKYCIRAEESEVKNNSGTVIDGGKALVIVNGGEFELLEDNKNCGPVGIKKNKVGNATVLIQARTEDKSINKAPKFKGNETALRTIMQYYIGTKAEKVDGTVKIKDSDDYALVKNSDGTYQVAERVAEIPASATVSVGYGSLQNAVDAAVAVDMSKSTDPLPITITRDITIDQMVKIIGNGTNETKIAISNDKAVTFDISVGNEGLRIANASVVLAGKGSWTRTNTSTKQIISVGEKNDDNSACAPGNLVVDGGSFTAEASAHIISVMNGVVIVNNGTFEVKGNEYTDRYCVRAEADPEVNEHNAFSYVVINGGTFITPAENVKGSACVAPVGTKKKDGADYNPVVLILELDTAGNPNSSLKFKGNETQICEVMGEFLGVIGEDGEPEYDEDNTYKFKLDTEDGFCKVVKTVWGAVNIEWAADKVVSFNYYEGEEVTNIVVGTDSSYSESYDIDDKTEVKIDKDTIKFATGYELDEEHSVLTAAVEEETTYTLKIVEKPTDTDTKAVDPETESKEYKTMEEANAYAQSINDYKYWMIKAPSTKIDKAKYVELFAAQLSQKTAEGGWFVTVKLTEDAKKTIEKEVNEVFTTAGDLDLSKVATSDTTFVATATPGLYYTVLSGTDVKDVSTMSTPVLAEGTTVELTLPKQEGNCGFYKVQVDVTKPTTPAE